MRVSVEYTCHRNPFFRFLSIVGGILVTTGAIMVLGSPVALKFIKNFDAWVVFVVMGFVTGGLGAAIQVLTAWLARRGDKSTPTHNLEPVVSPPSPTLQPIPANNGQSPLPPPCPSWLEAALAEAPRPVSQTSNSQQPAKPGLPLPPPPRPSSPPPRSVRPVSTPGPSVPASPSGQRLPPPPPPPRPN